MPAAKNLETNTVFTQQLVKISNVFSPRYLSLSKKCNFSVIHTISLNSISVSNQNIQRATSQCANTFTRKKTGGRKVMRLIINQIQHSAISPYMSFLYFPKILRLMLLASALSQRRIQNPLKHLRWRDLRK